MEFIQHFSYTLSIEAPTAAPAINQPMEVTVDIGGSRRTLPFPAIDDVETGAGCRLETQHEAQEPEQAGGGLFDGTFGIYEFLLVFMFVGAVILYKHKNKLNTSLC